MNTRCPPFRRRVAVVLLTLAIAGCSSLLFSDRNERPAIDGERLVADLTPDVEALYLAWHELDQILKDIKSLERGLLFDADDRQLGIVQKASLYVQDASLRVRHAWERLSVLAYIRPEMLRDYLTLTVGGLRSAVDAIAYDDRFLTIYLAYVENQALAADLERSQRRMRSLVVLMNGMIDTLAPLTDAGEAPIRL